MKKVFCSFALALLCFTGCTSTNRISPATVQQGVTLSVAYSSAKYTNAVPYLRGSAVAICAAAAGTNLSPADVVKAVEAANIDSKTPEAVLILNAALLFYNGVWDSYGEDALNKVPEIRPYLQATCDGINAGLPSTISLMKAAVAPATGRKPSWPQVSFP